MSARPAASKASGATASKARTKTSTTASRTPAAKSGTSSKSTTKATTAASKPPTSTTRSTARATPAASSSSSSKRPAAGKTATATRTTASTKAASGKTKPAAKRTTAAPASKKKAPAAAKADPEQLRRAAAATQLQRVARGFVARRQTARRQQQQAEYEAEMLRLEREAFVFLVKQEREAEERRLRKELERRKRIKEQQQRQQQLREAAFDGELATVQNLLRMGVEVEATDANGETALLEAAGGGQLEVVAVLVAHGANVNARGRFERTPLFRAAFAGHADVVGQLLEEGSDPRLYDSNGETAADVASSPAVAEVLAAWDVSRTDALLKTAEARVARLRAQQQQQLSARRDTLAAALEQAERAAAAKDKELRLARCNFENRVREHDLCVVENKGERLVGISLAVVKTAEEELETARQAAEAARAKLDEARLDLREHDFAGSEGGPDAGGDAAGGAAEAPLALAARCTIRELDEVLMRDVGGKIAADGRWPCLVDRSRQASTFLRYRDTNHLNVCRQADMAPETLRMALLGAIRFGKFLVLDMMDVDLYQPLAAYFDAVQPGLWASIAAGRRTLIGDDKYVSLIRSSDGEQYRAEYFVEARMAHFAIVFVTTALRPSTELLEQSYSIEILPAGGAPGI